MYREVSMIKVREVLRLRGEGLAKKRIAAQLGLDPKTVRQYLTAADSANVRVTSTISDDRQVVLALHAASGRPRGDGWARSVAQRTAIARWLGDGLRLTKIRKLLLRQGVAIAYPHCVALRSSSCNLSSSSMGRLSGARSVPISLRSINCLLRAIQRIGTGSPALAVRHVRNGNEQRRPG
jgi:hypothetical protein